MKNSRILHKPAQLFAALAVSSILSISLAACTAGGDSPAPSATSNSTLAPDQRVPSDENLIPENPSTELKQADAPPVWAEEAFSTLPESQWLYLYSDVEAMALSYYYQPEVLASFVLELNAAGWVTTIEPQVTEEGFVASFSRLSDSLVVVGTASGAPDGEGGTTAPATAITFTRS